MVGSKSYVTQKSLNFLRDRGEIPDVVEHYVQRPWSDKKRKGDAIPGYRKDMFGIIDIVSIGIKGIRFYQVTSASNIMSRIKKIMDASVHKFNRQLDESGRIAESMIYGGAELFVHGWEKKGNRWHLREVQLTTTRHPYNMYADKKYYRRQIYFIDEKKLYKWGQMDAIGG
jgi:hypothetical protein